ncbi:MAG: S24/S26 family peptidase [Chloroflexota bacterium]
MDTRNIYPKSSDIEDALGIEPQNIDPQNIDPQNIDPQSIEPRSVTDMAFKFWQQIGHPHWHVVHGISMWPFLHKGDRVLVQPSHDQLSIGDIVLIRFPSCFIVHRIVSLEPNGSVTTWGDFNLCPEEQAKKDQIVGKVVEIERKRRQISIGQRRRMWGYLVLRLRPILLPCIWITRKIIRSLHLLIRH